MDPSTTVIAGKSSLRNLLSVNDLGADGLHEMMRITDFFAEVSARPIPKVPVLRGKTIACAFFENSTRTRLSFEAAAKRLSADTMSFGVSGSSISKGESFKDTIMTIDSLGADAIVVRHPSAGAANQVARWVSKPVVNAGDGSHEHPTQALLDCYTIREALKEKSLSGLRIAVVGDLSHSRVARSNVLAMSAMGAVVTLVAPRTLWPASLDGWPVHEITCDLDPILAHTDLVYLLRLQVERGAGGLLPSLREYTATYGLTARRAAMMPKGALVMHPGPVNRGVEMSSEVAEMPTTLVGHQVANGVLVRMAVLYYLLAGPEGVDAMDVSRDASVLLDAESASLVALDG
jgi:aspartate carbamoyltransferase catalytic subunit